MKDSFTMYKNYMTSITYSLELDLFIHLSTYASNHRDS